MSSAACSDLWTRMHAVCSSADAIAPAAGYQQKWHDVLLCFACGLVSLRRTITTTAAGTAVVAHWATDGYRC
jgi:hypothetical protein